MEKFVLFLNSRDKVVEYPLPAVDNRTVNIRLDDIYVDASITLEIYDGVWKILSSSEVTFSGSDNKRVDSYTIKGGDILKGITFKHETFAVIVCVVDRAIAEFVKYDISHCDKITLGRTDGNDIKADSPYISASHAVIAKHSGKYAIEDLSSNGTFINGSKIAGKYYLNYGDIIYTIGFKIVFLGNVIAINRRDIVDCRLTPYRVPDVIPADKEPEDHSGESEYFSRSPRDIEPLFSDDIDIDQPPSPQKQRNQPLLFVVGPSVTMPLPILMSTLINTQINNSSSMSYIATISSVVMSALMGMGWALAHRRYNKKQMQSEEEFRVSAYTAYIDKNKKLLEEKHSLNDSLLVSRYLSTDVIIDRLSADNTFLWNRNPGHDDFMFVRAGVGPAKFSGEIHVSKQRFSVYNDEMAELPHKLKEEFEYMPNTVSLLDLRSERVIGILGEESDVNDVVRNLIVQTAALHCYTDLKIAAFYESHEAADYSWIRWLPHTYSDDMRHRNVADNPASYTDVLYSIGSILRTRLESAEENNDKQGSMLPHIIVLCTSESIFSGDPIEKYMSVADKIGVTFVLVYKKMNKLPNTCKLIVECGKNFTGIYNLEETRGLINRIDLERTSIAQAERFSRSISGLRVRQIASGEIPMTITYFQMLGIGRIEQWDLIKHYKENRVYEEIKSFVGIGGGGKPMYIDIHEKKHGPHGLVAGTTGSGKSETLQTFIISLALNYSPDELGFILIDYKGGGMANIFKDMPHISGIIDNLEDDENEGGELDANLTRRALLSIKSETKRRLGIFKKYGLNHIDQYIKLYRNGKADEPLPHLIIISDEFAELKKEQPEFIKELVSTARVGRSLGIHLILATQKPGGVVDDEIWSNSRFKLCLRVQDKQDSIGMLKRPEAAYLTQTGRAYFQLGNDEIFEQFQTGYSGAPYYPKDSVNDASGEEIAMIGIDGSRLVVHDNSSKKSGSKSSELDAAVKYITAKCAENRIRPVRPMWLPTIPKNIYPDEIPGAAELQNSGITAVYGLVDHPDKQRQFAASIALDRCSNLIIAGSAGMGKTTLIETMLVSLLGRYTAEQVQFYIYDFSGRTLKMFNNAPHCGFVAFSDDNEGVVRTFRFIDRTINERKALFNESNVGSYTEYVKTAELPLILFIIDNFVSFSELYPNMSDDFIRLTRDCAKYGIQTIISVSNLNDVRSKARQNFSNIITLVMNEKGDYRDAWGVSAEFLPKHCKGRGLTLADGQLLEYQTALPVRGENETERNRTIAEMASNLTSRTRAARIAVLPHDQTYSDFLATNHIAGTVPIGYITSDISVYSIDLHDIFCYAVSDVGTKGISLVLDNTIEAAKAEGADIIAIKMKNDIKITGVPGAQCYKGAEGIREAVTRITGELKERAAVKRQFLEQEPEGDFTRVILGQFRKVFVIIDSMSEFLSEVYTNAECEDIRKVLETAFKKSGGMGMYFFAGYDQASHSGTFGYAASKNFVSNGTGIHLGGCYDKQRLFNVNMPISKLSKPLDYFTGYTIAGGDGVNIFVPHC